MAAASWRLVAESLFLPETRFVPRLCLCRNLSSSVVLQNKTTKKTRRGESHSARKRRLNKYRKKQTVPQESDSSEDKIFFQNHNPRSLELLGVAVKPKGFATKMGRTAYYHRLMVDFSNRHISAYVQHNSGLKVVQASTKEFCISKYLYRTTDLAAAHNIGRVLASRCKDMGLYRVMWEHNLERRSKKVRTLAYAVSLGGVALNEPRFRTVQPQPGKLPPTLHSDGDISQIVVV